MTSFIKCQYPSPGIHEMTMPKWRCGCDWVWWTVAFLCISLPSINLPTAYAADASQMDPETSAQMFAGRQAFPVPKPKSTAIPGPRSSTEAQRRMESVRNMTYLLDSLLEGYDKSIRPPTEAGQPTVVNVDMLVLSMGPISEADMAYQMDCYFRQTWQDTRLKFKSVNRQSVTLHLSMLEKIWKPDTYFWNGKNSYLHKLTVPNKFVRLSADGVVYFSSRLTIKASCPMFLRKFPLDVQKCPLSLGSFAYTTKEIQYRWKYGLIINSTRVARGLVLSQFALKKISLREDEKEAIHGLYSRLELKFLFERRYGYFLINFYGPCSLIVILSWVAFWINREATADRIGLGVTSILTMTFLFLDSRADLPRVHYPTALDVYLILCYSFVLGTILEFSVVHTFTKYGTGDPELRFLEKERLDEINEIAAGETEDGQKNGGVYSRSLPTEVAHSGGWRKKKRPAGLTLPASLAIYGDLSAYVAKPGKWETWKDTWKAIGKKADPFDVEMNSVSRIDQLARMMFPIIFAFISILYWNSYLSESESEDFGPASPTYGVITLPDMGP